MIWGILIALSASAVAVCIAIFARSVALRGSEESLSKCLREHSTRLTDLEDTTEALAAQLKNERARRNMASHRERKAQAAQADQVEPTDAAATRAALTRDLVAGRISPLRPKQ